MRKCLSLLILLMYGLLSGTPAHAEEGPLGVQNRFPLHLLFLTPRPVSPELPSAGSWRTTAALDYSAVYFQYDNPQWDFLIDLEMTTFNLAVTYGLMPRVAVQIDLDVVNMWEGFLDGLLENYHQALGVGNYGREERPKNTFVYRVSREGEKWLEGESSEWQLADSVVSALVKLPAWSRMRHAAIASLKVPSGDSTQGTGSGRWDAGLYWSTVFDFDPWSFYLMPGIALIADPQTEGVEVSARNVYSLFAGMAYRYNERWRWLAQLNSYTSPIQETGINELDDGAVELALGFHYRPATQWQIEFAFCEDLTRAAPDFTVHLAIMLERP